MRLQSAAGFSAGGRLGATRWALQYQWVRPAMLRTKNGTSTAAAMAPPPMFPPEPEVSASADVSSEKPSCQPAPSLSALHLL